MAVRVSQWLQAKISELCKEENGKWIDFRLSLLIQEGPLMVATRSTSNRAETLTFF